MTIGESLARCAIARGGEIDDITTEVYLDALSDLSPEFVARACAQLGKKPRELYETVLPPVGDIRQLVHDLEVLDRDEAAKRLMLPPPRDDNDPRVWFACDKCEDTGWVFHECPRDDCGRPRQHSPHTFVVRCLCYERNPVIARDRERSAKFKANPTRRSA